MTGSALKTVSLAIGYGKRRVAQDIDLSIFPGEVLCLLGPNGSGKTTLFRTLLGLLPPQGGELFVLGKPVAEWSREAFAYHVGYVPQAHVGLFPFTVTDMVLMGRAARIGQFSSPGPGDRKIASDCMERLGIAHLANRFYTEISGGERQLTLIARAMAQEPALLIMDEPTASLDFGNQIRVLEHIGQLRSQGIAVLLSTHQPEHAQSVADRVALFGNGRMALVGSAAQTITAARLAKLYDVSEEAVNSRLNCTCRTAANF